LVFDIKRRTFPEGFGNRTIRDIFRPVGDEVREGLKKKSVMRSFMICNCRHLLFSRSNQERLAGHVACTTKNKNAYTSSAGKFKEREHLENVEVNGTILNES
jgi:hypothetical protein